MILTVKNIAVLFLLLFLFLYGVSGITILKPGETGLVIKMLGEDRGIVEKPLDTGTHWFDPLVYDIEIYDVRFQQYTVREIQTQTKDGQPVLVDVSLEMGLEDNLVRNIHETIGHEYWSSVIYPALRSAIRDNVPSKLSDEVYTADGRKAIQNLIQVMFETNYKPRGFNILVNLRDINFTNPNFIATLEEKAAASQRVTIEKRNAEAAEQTAIKVGNVAEGQKQKVIRQAEAEREKLKLEGEGYELQKKAQARGNLAVFRAKAEGTRLQVNAFGTGETYASVRWAEEIGDNIKILGYPLGAPGTTGLFNVDGILGQALKVKGGK